MRYRSSDIVSRAIEVLDDYGLADLTMRRLSAELGLQPSALYHHFANKQTLLGEVADEILRRGRREARPAAWDRRLSMICTELRDSMLAYRDGAEVVATGYAFGLGATVPYTELLAALIGAGFTEAEARTAARTLLYFVFGHTADEQIHLQAGSAGAIAEAPRQSTDFGLGLDLVIDGIRMRRPARGR